MVQLRMKCVVFGTSSEAFAFRHYKLNVLGFGVEGGRSGVQGGVICRLWTKAMVRAIRRQLEEVPELLQSLQGRIGSDASSTGYKYDNCDLWPLHVDSDYRSGLSACRITGSPTLRATEYSSRGSHLMLI